MRVPKRQSLYLSGFAYLALLVCLSLFQFTQWPTLEAYEGFKEVHWTTNCPTDSLPATYQLGGKHRGTLKSNAVCKSEWLELSGNTISFDYAGRGKNRKHHALYLAVQLKNGEDIKTLMRLPAPEDKDDPRDTWKEVRLNLQTSEKLRFVIVDKSPDGWLALRNRVSFYQSGQLPSVPKLPIFYALAFVIAFFALPKGKALYPTLLLIAVGLHFRAGPDFNLDDWLLMNIIYSRPNALFETFNAHFIPLFVSAFYLQNKLFGDTYWLYLLTSIAAQALTACSLIRIVESLSNNYRVASALGLLFLFNSLHIDSMQWLICQAVAFSTCAMFIGLSYGLQFSDSKKPLDFILSMLALTAAPLFFGQGLVGLPVLLCLLSLKKKSISALYKDQLLRDFLITVSLLTGAVVALYLFFQSGEGHEAAGAISKATFWRFFDFVFYSSHFTTIMGGLGLGVFDSPALIPPSYFDWLQSFLSPSSLRYAPTTGLITILILQVVVYLSLKKVRKQQLWYFIVGELVLLMPLILVGLGRSHFPLYQAQAFRYQAMPLLGLIIFLIPFFKLLSKRSGILMHTLLFVLCFRHLDTLDNFTSYSENGVQMRRFIVELSDWMPRVQDSDYEGDNTEYEGLYPLRHANPREFISAVPTVLHPDDLYKLLKWLK